MFSSSCKNRRLCPEAVGSRSSGPGVVLRFSPDGSMTSSTSSTAPRWCLRLGDYWRGRAARVFWPPWRPSLAAAWCSAASTMRWLTVWIQDGWGTSWIGHLGGRPRGHQRCVSRPAAWRPDYAALTALASASEAELLTRWRKTLEAVNQHWDRILPESLLKAPARWWLQLKTKLRPIGSLLPLDAAAFGARTAASVFELDQVVIPDHLMGGGGHAGRRRCLPQVPVIDRLRAASPV